MLSSKWSITSCAAALLMALTPAVPAGAMPVSAPQVEKTSDVQAIQYRHDRHDRRYYRHNNRGPGWQGGHRGPGWYGGHRGYRHQRPGYRRHSDGWWYPLAAFGAGAIIGGAINSRPAQASGSAHYQWCASRYRTYRASDNTYVPRAGVRAQCNSPYN